MNNKMLYFLTIIVIIIVLIIVFMLQKGIIGMNSIQSVQVICLDENIDIEIVDEDDLDIMKKILNKKGQKLSPSCPFGYAELAVKTNNKVITLYPSTDDCYIFQIKGQEKYFTVSSEDWETLMSVLKKYNIEQTIFEGGKGI